MPLPRLQTFIMIVYLIELWHLPLIPLYFFLKSFVRRRMNRLMRQSRFSRRSRERESEIIGGDASTFLKSSAEMETEEWILDNEEYGEDFVSGLVTDDKQVRCRVWVVV